MVKSGSLLIANPAHAQHYNDEAVIIITESTPVTTVGLRLNLKEKRALEEIVRPEYIDTFPASSVYISGPHTPGALICFHSNEWFSRNTMPITKTWSISSDEVMLEKLSMQDYPDFFKLCLGFTVWDTKELTADLKSKSSSWVSLKNPSDSLIMSDANKMWNRSIKEVTHEAVESYM